MKLKDLMNETVRVDTTSYRASHSKEPKGTGQWMFDIDGKEYTFKGTYASAKKQAMKQAKQVGAYSLKVLP